ncbi:MAG: cysteine--tRNA ligase [Verrucomicrobiota bacterium]|nr:cysteine--tRNA ligase [Verrucomicrobiota bacterium]
MSFTIFNTLTRRLEEFSPLQGNEVSMYCCGPTVHNFAHIGNFRTFVFSDLFRRYLEFRGFNVRHVMNITDVEDKIIASVRQNGRPLKEFTGEYEKAFLEDFDLLNCKRPHDLPHATDFIPQIITLIEKLMARGIAYRASDGSVYFSISKYIGCGCKYGQLVNLNFEEMRVGERVSSDEYAKESVADFALWKARVPEDGEISWASPWGEGRPGWHIECSAMSMDLLGNSFDLHLGGEDLAFPHHEDEIAQSEGAGLQKPGEKFVKYWAHVAHLLVEGKKMAKSLGNFFTLRDLVAKGFQGREVRFLLLAAHYRESFNFTLEGLHGARTALNRIDEQLLKLRELAGGEKGTPNPQVMAQFTELMDDDLNVSGAWGSLFEWVRDTNRLISESRFLPHDAANALATWEQIDAVFAILKKAETEEVPQELIDLLEQRQTARKAKDFKRSDAIRDELKAKGWVIEDTPKGPRLKKI